MNCFLVDGVRTPIGSFGGSLSSVRADDLAAIVLRSLTARYPNIAVDEVILGCANQAGEDNRNVARMALLLSGMSPSVPALTVNRLCASGMSAVVSGAQSILLGDSQCVIAGGVEQMTRAPYVLSKTAQPFGRGAELFDTTMGWRFINKNLQAMYGTDSMGETAENVAELFKITRAEQDEFAYHSQQKATKGLERKVFEEEIVPVEIPQAKGDPISFSKDEFIKPHTTVEALAKLKAAFKKDGTVTAGNSSGINDGACVLLLASEKIVEEHGLTPLAKYVSTHAVGVKPNIMGIGPVEASKGALKKAGLTLKDISVIELNEAFAAQSIACLRDLGISPDDTRVNPNGGAIALGHPLGMSGARLLLTAARELERTKGKYALCTLCVGVGQGVATIIERV